MFIQGRIECRAWEEPKRYSRKGLTIAIGESPSNLVCSREKLKEENKLKEGPTEGELSPKLE